MAFGFDKYHSSVNYSARPYKKYVIDVANSLNPDLVVELGCGLGDIISRVRAKKRFGVDPYKSVIRAARFLHPLGVEWIVGDAATISSIAPGERINCFLAIGCLHFISREELAALMTPLVERTDYFLVDKFNYDLQPGRFDHDFAFFSGLATCISDVTPCNDDIRRYLLFKSDRR